MHLRVLQTQSMKAVCIMGEHGPVSSPHERVSMGRAVLSYPRSHATCHASLL